MKPSISQDASLYELALSSEQPPHSLQISPTIFKSLVSTVFDLLIDQAIPATVWLKLPKGEVWQSEFDRYRKSATAPYIVYTFSSSKEDTDGPSTMTLNGAEAEAEGTEEPTAIFTNGTVTPERFNVETSGTEKPSHTITISLGTDTQLRREYFLLVLSAGFSGLFLAHRPRQNRLPRPDGAKSETVAASGDRPGEEEVERKHPLLAVCSFAPHTLQSVVKGMQRAIANEYSGLVPPDLDALLQQWDTLIPLKTKESLNPFVMGQLLTRQIRRQEEVWHSSYHYRRQADTATTLQMENEELQNAIRLKDEFLQNVGQELRAPLATMKTALTLLNASSLKPVQRQRYMDMLSHECDRQSALITSVLDLIQIENTIDQSPNQPIRLSDVVPGIVSTYQPLAQEKGITVAYTVPEGLPAVSCSSPWLRQIVINLLHNSIKFTPQGGRVWVRAKQQGDFVQVEVRDTGIGIASSDIPKIFDRFYKVRQNGDGSGGVGLGLSIVQQLLLRCGGSISVNSKLNEGSTFNVLLPLYDR